jgi:hypothetical protein
MDKKPPKDRNLPAGSEDKKGNRLNILAMRYCFFFKEKRVSQHQIYSTENWEMS